jgi:C_GCAxxG_C_C family probable redox protein
MKKSEITLKTFNESYNCSQAVFTTFTDELGLDKKTACKVAGAFGGGVARNGEVCGAVTGALMAIGLKYWNEELSPADAKTEVTGIANKFIEEFKSKHKSIRCKELLDADLSTKEGRQKMKDENLHEKICSKLVCDATEILEKSF